MCKTGSKRMKYYLRGKSLEHLILNPKKKDGGCYTMYTMYTRFPSLGGGTPLVRV